MVRYKHSLNAGLLRGLVALARVREANLADLGLSYNDRCNFQKLRYWGLVEGCKRADGSPLLGSWRVTRLGLAWLCGDLKVPRSMWTYRGEPTSADGDRITVDDVEPAYTTRPEWARLRESIRTDPGYGEPVAML
ncbi:MAG: hypothetical protein KGH75_00215 [Rhodospirillales bacterium]|nr:hypothetical protein [Rhodospirillales bacterium]